MDTLAQFSIIPVEYSEIKSVLADFRSPRHKIADLEKAGKLVRLKKGLYVVSPTVTEKILSTELIANHLYGPSYVSMENALRYYGLIPESVYTVTSMTLKRARDFENSLGQFKYVSCSPKYYSIGVRSIKSEDFSFLMASPEKALCDLIVSTPYLRLRFIKALRIYLEEDLRLDMEAFQAMDAEIFRACATVSKKKTDLLNLAKLIER